MTRLVFAVLTLAFFTSAAHAGGPAAFASYGAGICCERCIDYRHHHPRREPCGPRYEQCLLVKDVCACCYVKVPVCIPVCCVGEPEICCHGGILGRQVVEYAWCCGYRIKIVIDRKGDVVVHYNV
jgi:hypothetical protein